MPGRLAIVALVVASVLLGAAVPALGAAGPVDFEQRAPAAAARAAAAGGDAGPGAARLVSAPLRAPHRFDLFGLRWRGGRAHVDVRVQRVDGSWSRWVRAPHGEDAPRRGRGDEVTAPIWTGGAVRWQVRSERPLRDLRAHFVAVPRPRRSVVAARAPVAQGTSGRPAIVPRSQWDPTNACPPRSAPHYGRVDFAFVHHTESLSSYSPADSAAIVLAICRFHRNGNGWFDIGYNLLVDRYGTIFEGRAGGAAEPVIGAQAGGWNSVSTGISVIGSYSYAPPPMAARRALAQALAWKLSIAGVPAQGGIAETSLGGSENRWDAGSRVDFQRVSGHRDGDQTDCPGAALYGLLPRLRAMTATLHATPRNLLTISPVGGALPPGGPAQLTGRLALADGRRPTGARVVVQARLGGVWTNVGSVKTAVDGTWTTAVPLTLNGTLRLVAPRYAVTSRAVSAHVEAGITAQVSPQRLRPGARVRVRGMTSPAKPRVTVLVERKTASGRWVRVRRIVAATFGGAYDVPVTLRAPGIHRFVVTTAADAQNAAGVAPVRTARVLRRR